MGMTANIVAGGFSDPVFDSQHVFKALMNGMARPGTIQSFDLSIGTPAPLGHAAGSILLTMCDHDTPVWMSGAFSASVVPSWLSFHTGAPVVQEKSEARFALVDSGRVLSSFGLFAQGTQEYPDRSATVIVEVSDLDTGPDLILTGPGISDIETIRPAGLPDVFVRLWSENRTVFPRGVDVILSCDNRFLCLPRSTRIQTKEV